MSADLICPGCGSPVPNTDLFGWIEPSVYDGILIWADQRCGHRWPRFPPGDHRHDKAASLIALSDVIPGAAS